MILLYVFGCIFYLLASMVVLYSRRSNCDTVFHDVVLFIFTFGALATAIGGADLFCFSGFFALGLIVLVMILGDWLKEK